MLSSLERELRDATGGAAATADEAALLRESVELYSSLGPYAMQRAVGSIVSARAKIGWSTWGHTGVDVPLHATGPGSERFRGSIENSTQCTFPSVHC